MNDGQEEMSYSQYYTIISSAESNINKDQIFFREKYDEIINYLRALLVKDEDGLIYQYSHPKGALLVNVNKGTDLFEFFKLISTNYNLNLIQFNIDKILENPQDFYANFNLIVEEMLKSSSKYIERLSEEFDKENKIKKLVLVEQVSKVDFENNNFLRIFLNHFLKKSPDYSFIGQQTILFWINHDITEIIENSQDVFQFFDCFIKIAPLTKKDRETIFSQLSEKYPKIVFDIKTLVDLTQNWEIRDINQLIKMAIFKHYLNSELNDMSNEITDVLRSLIESGEFIPLISNNQKSLESNPKNQNIEINNPENLISGIISDIQNQNISDFMLNQLYESAASEKYTELLIILDKLNKNEILEENDLKLLSRYPFVLNDKPHMAQINLEKAKKRIEQIKQAFGK